MKYLLMSVFGLLLCAGLAAQTVCGPQGRMAADADIVCLGRADAAELKYDACTVADVNLESESAEQAARSVRSGALDEFSPKVIVLNVGAEGAGLSRGKPWACARGVADLLYVLRDRQPQAKILLMSIFPSHEPRLVTPIRNTNRLLSTLADGEHVVYVDVGEALMLPKSGRPDPELLSTVDCHPTEEGCRRIARVLRPTLERLLK